MHNMNKVRYKLAWPGFRSVPIYIIDTNDVVYGIDNHLPPGRRHLNTIDFQYVKLHSIMSMLSEQERFQGNACLNKLIIEFCLRSMRTIACCSVTPIGQQVVVDQYLPVATLLPFLMIFPSKAFGGLQNSVLDYLDNNLDLTCMSCGFINRNCMCRPGEQVEDFEDSVGFAITYEDKEIQTTFSVPDKEAPSMPPPPPLQCMEAMSQNVTNKTKPDPKQKTPPPGSTVSILKSNNSSDIPSPTIMTGVGGIKIKLPPMTKLQPGAKMPLKMFHGAEGPCLVPADNDKSNGFPDMPDPMLGNAAGPMSMAPRLPLLGPGAGYTPVNMPPFFPNMDMSMSDPNMLGMPPNITIPPGSYMPPNFSAPNYYNNSMLGNSTQAPYTNMPIMSNYSSSAYDAGTTPSEFGMPRGQVTVRLPKNLNPKYINTVLGTFKRMNGTRNIGIQVETVILPKKKSTLVTNMDVCAKKSTAKDKLNKDQDNDNKADSTSTKVKKVKIKIPPGEGAAAVVDDKEMTITIGEENKVKVPYKKADKLWRIIEDDSEDSEDEDVKKNKEAEEEANVAGNDGEKPVSGTEAEGKDKTMGDQPKDEKVDGASENAVDNDTAEGENMKASSSSVTFQTSLKADVIGLASVAPSLELPSTVSPAVDESSDITKITDNSTPVDDLDLIKDRAGINLTHSQKGTSNSAISVPKNSTTAIEVDAAKSSGKDLTPDADHTEESAVPDLAETSTIGENAEDSADISHTSVSDMDTSNANDMDTTIPADIGASMKPTETSSVIDLPSGEKRISPVIDVTSDEEAMRRSLAVEALESLASMGRVDPVIKTDSTETKAPIDSVAFEKPGSDKTESNVAEITEQNSGSQSTSVSNDATADIADQVKSVPDVSTVGKDEHSVTNDDLDESALIIDEGKPSEDTTKEPTEKDQEAIWPENKETSIDLLESPSKPMLPNFDHEKKYFAKFEHVPTGEKLYKCTFPRCTQCFDTRVAAKQHNQCHSKDTTIRSLLCLQCDYKTPFFRWFDLLRHIRETHKTGLTEDPNGCLFCGLVFESHERLARHLEFHYSSRYKCVHCGMMMMSWGQVKQHIENCPEKDQTKVNFGCPYCMFVFHKRTIRNLHMLSHSDKGLSCALCEDSEVNWEHWKLLRKHYQARHAKVLTTKILPFRELLPMKKRNPKCHVCSTEFKTNDLYNIHMVKAHDFVPYSMLPCHLCNQAFRTKRRLDYHIKSGHEEEAHCDECDFVAKNKTFLKLHMTQKHSDKQQMCTECGKTFMYYHQLKVHMAHHARKIVHQCKFCVEEFTRSAELRKHIADKHSDPGEKKAHYCNQCSYWTYTKSTLAYHKDKKHNSNPGAQVDDLDRSGDISGDLDILSDQNAEPQQMYPQAYQFKPPEHKYKRSYEPSESTRGGGRGRKKRKRLTMQAQRKPVPRISKESDITSVRPLKRWIPQKPVRNRDERKRLRVEEDEQKKLKRMRRDSSARTRSLEEQKAIHDDIEMDILEAEQLELAKSRGILAPGKKYSRSTSRDESTVINLSYPYIDHNYYQLETQATFRQPVAPTYKPNYDYSMPDFSIIPDPMNVVNTPSVSGFEECETSPTHPKGARTRGRGYNRRSSVPAKFTTPNLPAFLSDIDGPVSSSTPLQSSSASNILHSPVQIRSLLSHALNSSPTKGNRDRVSQLSQQLRSIAMDMPSLEDFPELINETGMIPEQDLGLITDILNSMDTSSISSRLSDGTTTSQDLSLGDQNATAETSRVMFSNENELPFSEEPPVLAESGDQPVLANSTIISRVMENNAEANVTNNNSAVVVEVLPKQPIVRQHSTDTSFDEGILNTSDSLPAELPSDLDEIELKEADYHLWHDNPDASNPQPADTSFDESLANAQIIVEFKDNEMTSANRPRNLDIVAAVEEDRKKPQAWLMDHQYC